MENRQPFSESRTGRLLAIGDIHGCYQELCEVLDCLAPDLQRDYLVILGDLIDRGPDSYAVVQKARQLQASFGTEHVIVLRGNHEQMALDYFSGAGDWWDYNGNEFTLASYETHGATIQSDLDYFAKLPLTYERNGFLFVHAGLNPHKSLEKQVDSDLLWIREAFYNSRKHWPFTIVFGHTPTYALVRQNIPVSRSGWIALDTGCVYGGNLTGVELEAGVIANSCSVKRKDGRNGFAD
ncbi:MAG: metallophosphoesterase family protein [Eubacteriales bacterium]|nr:metallophosphoesterase family protein [Eubacteriales bacterium]